MQLGAACATAQQAHRLSEPVVLSFGASLTFAVSGFKNVRSLTSSCSINLRFLMLCEAPKREIQEQLKLFVEADKLIRTMIQHQHKLKSKVRSL